jgi:hypothetical protein
VPTGHIPRMMTVHCLGENTRACSPGDEVTITGLSACPRGFCALMTCCGNALQHAVGVLDALCVYAYSCMCTRIHVCLHVFMYVFIHLLDLPCAEGPEKGLIRSTSHQETCKWTCSNGSLPHVGTLNVHVRMVSNANTTKNVAN